MQCQDDYNLKEPVFNHLMDENGDFSSTVHVQYGDIINIFDGIPKDTDALKWSNHPRESGRLEFLGGWNN